MIDSPVTDSLAKWMKSDPDFVGTLRFQLALQVMHVVVLEVADVAARGQQALLDGEIHSVVGENHVAPLGVGRDGTSDRWKAVCIDGRLF